MRARSPARRFALRFFACLLLSAAAAWVIALPARLGWLQRFLARAAGTLAAWTGGRNAVVGTQVWAGPLRIDITYECTGIYVAVILASFFLAYPAAARARLQGIAAGLAGLLVLNVLRLTFLVRVAEVHPALFAYMHEYLWQGVFLLAAVLHAVWWVDRVR